MIRDKRTLILGICILLIPFLGFPSAWKTFFVLLVGLVLVSLSVQISIPRKIPRRTRRKETITPAFRESMLPNVRKDKPSEVKITTGENE